MLHAYDEGMTNGDYVFIMFELDVTQVSLYTRQPFKWFFSSYSSTLNRYHHVKKAFEAAFVLAIKSPSSESYPRFTAELRRRSPDPPFDSHVYEGYLWKKNLKSLANKIEVSDSSKIYHSYQGYQFPLPHLLSTLASLFSGLLVCFVYQCWYF